MKAAARMLVVALAAMLAAPGLTAQETATADDCGVCHEDYVDSFAASRHGRAIAGSSAGRFQASCVACHGPGETHMEELTAESIQKQPDRQACLTCHPGASMEIERSSPAHNRHGVACLECHDASHAGVDREGLLLDEPLELCSSCHVDTVTSFRLPFAHRDGNEPMDCTNCHSVHLDRRSARAALISGDGACADCHTEKTRPFVFAHPPASREGCTSCHRPHGSPNPKQLTRRDVRLLCLECHSAVPAFHDLSDPRYRNCQTCHAAIHGSNRDPALIEE